MRFPSPAAFMTTQPHSVAKLPLSLMIIMLAQRTALQVAYEMCMAY